MLLKLKEIFDKTRNFAKTQENFAKTQGNRQICLFVFTELQRKNKPKIDRSASKGRR